MKDEVKEDQMKHFQKPKLLWLQMLQTQFFFVINDKNGV